MTNPFRLFIQNFDYTVSDSELFAFLDQQAKVAAVKIVRHADGRSKGYAFADVSLLINRAG